MRQGICGNPDEIVLSIEIRIMEPGYSVDWEYKNINVQYSEGCSTLEDARDKVQQIVNNMVSAS
jgi:hypothetical protein